MTAKLPRCSPGVSGSDRSQHMVEGQMCCIQQSSTEPQKPSCWGKAGSEAGVRLG